MLSTAPVRAYIPASDVRRARKFYEHTVGLTPKEDYAGDVIYECGGTEVFLYPTSNAGTSKASQAYGAKTARFKDTEGNILAVSQRL